MEINIAYSLLRTVGIVGDDKLLQMLVPAMPIVAIWLVDILKRVLGITFKTKIENKGKIEIQMAVSIFLGLLMTGLVYGQNDFMQLDAVGKGTVCVAFMVYIKSVSTALYQGTFISRIPVVGEYLSFKSVFDRIDAYADRKDLEKVEGLG